MRTNTKKDPLAALVIDAQSVDRERLAKALEGRVRIDPRESLIRFMPGIKQQATIKQLILAALLGQMAIRLLNVEQPEGLTPGELAQCTGAKGSSLRPQLKALADDEIVLKNSAALYVVPAHSFGRVLEMLGDQDD